MRLLLATLPLLLLVSFAGCGDTGPPALRIEVEVFSFDGELPDGLRIRQLRPDGTEGLAFDLQPVAGGRGGEYEAPGAPDGAYALEGPAGWWMLHDGVSPPQLAQGLQPPRVGLGRERSLYLGAESPAVRPSDVWGVVRLGPDGRQEPVPVTAEADDAGYVVALRFSPEAWRGTLRAVGRIALGAPPTPSPGADAPLAAAVQFEASPDGRPVVQRVHMSPAEALQVVLVPAGPDLETDGLRVRASIAGLPIPSAFEAYARGGLAGIADVPVVDHRLHVALGEAQGAHRLDPMDRRRQANLRLLATGDLPRVRVRVLAEAEAAEVREVDLVLVRPAGAVAFGRVPFERVEGGVTFQVPYGERTLLLRSGTHWAEVEGDGSEPVELHLSAAGFRAGVAVGGSVDGAPPGAVVRFFREVGESGQAVLADGFEVRVEPGGLFEALLPTGRYRVEVATRLGVWRRPAPLIAESEGARLHLPLESP